MMMDLMRVARSFHALADEIRLSVVEQRRGGEQCVSDLTDALEAGQSRPSFPLKTLKDAGLVMYVLNPQAITLLEEALGGRRPWRPGFRMVSRRCD